MDKTRTRSRTRTLSRRLLVMVLSAFLAAALFSYRAHAASYENCATPAEVDAFKTRMIQTDLMIGAMACDLGQNYRRFLRKYNVNLHQQNTVLRDYFRRVYAAKGDEELHTFLTRLANLASQRSVEQPAAGYCAATYGVFREILMNAEDTVPVKQSISFQQEIRNFRLQRCG